jgi:peptidoglycan/LPS O-acetylase OafA/YrhL
VSSAKRVGDDPYYSYFGTFYANRARRILPAAALTLIVTDLAATYLLNLSRAHQVLVDGVWATFFAANIHFASIGANYFAIGAPPSPIQHFWSLAVEEQFYVVWPLLVGAVLVGAAIVRRRRNRTPRRISPRATRRLMAMIGVIVIVSAAYAVYDTHHSPASAYFSTPARAWELGLGALLFLNAPRFSRLPSAAQALLGWGGIGGIVVASTTYSANTSFPGVAALLPTLGAAAVIAAGFSVQQSACAPSRVLSMWVCRFVGDRSYTFYLWHWPFLVLAAEHVGHSLPVATNLLLLIAAFLLSMVTYACFENPIRRTTSLRGAAALALWPAAILTVLVVTAVHWQDLQNAVNQAYVPPTPPTLAPPPKIASLPAAGGTQSDVTPGTPPAVIAAVAAATTGRGIPSVLTPPVLSLSTADTYALPQGCVALPGQTRTPICRLGATAGAKSLVVFGDSHAQMWMPDILSFARREGYDVRPMIKLSCTAVIWAGSGQSNVVTNSADCRAWYKWAVATLRGMRPSLVIVVSHYEDIADSPELVMQTLNNFARFEASVRSVTRQLVVLGDGPGQRADLAPVDCLQRSGATFLSCSSPDSQSEAALTADVASEAQGAGAFLDTTPWFCYAHVCPMVVGHTIAYADSNHMTAVYAHELEPLFDGVLEQLLVRGDALTSSRRPR